MTIPGHRNYQFWNFSRPTLWASLDAGGVPAVGRSYLLRHFALTVEEPFRRLPLFENQRKTSRNKQSNALLPVAEIVWSDPFALVAYKTPGVKVHPNDSTDTDTLLHRVQLAREVEGWAQDRMRHIHRLDEATSGLVLFASCDYAHHVLDAMMRDRLIKRTYVAWVEGHPAKLQGTIDAPIGRDKMHPTRRRVSPGGQEAVTHYRVLDRRGRFSLLELTLETGRTHQIRVHMKYAGFPIVNDPLYGKISFEGKPMTLCGKQLRFPHPWHGHPVEVSIDIPIEWDMF
jgi:23S rRNA pseudouridine1911/1915/1917 synthase